MDYLDNAATTPVSEEVAAAMAPFLSDFFHNPSAPYGPGHRARAAIDRSREAILAGLGLEGATVVFTSGGTEANNLALLGCARRRRTDRVVISSIEHPSVREPAKRAAAEAGVPLVEAPVTPEGVTDPEALADLLGPKTTLVAVLAVQNEIGTVQPIARIARIVRERAPRAHLHVDAVQALGKIDLGAVVPHADSLALSAHKIHGPKGVGALVLRSGVLPEPILYGGGQEHGLRSGTENVAGIVGFGVAVEAALRDAASARRRLEEARREVERAFDSLPGARILGAGAERSPAIVAARVPGVRAEVLQHHLESEGILVGIGSACHSRKREISPTFEALGLSSEEAREVLRVSLSPHTPMESVRRFAAALPAAVARVREAVG